MIDAVQVETVIERVTDCSEAHLSIPYRFRLRNQIMKRIVFLFALAVGIASVLPSISTAQDHHSSHGYPAYGYSAGHGYSGGHDYAGSGQGYTGHANYGHGYQPQYAPSNGHGGPVHSDCGYGGHGFSFPSHVGHRYNPSNGYGSGFQVSTPHFGLRIGH